MYSTLLETVVKIATRKRKILSLEEARIVIENLRKKVFKGENEEIRRNHPIDMLKIIPFVIQEHTHVVGLFLKQQNNPDNFIYFSTFHPSMVKLENKKMTVNFDELTAAWMKINTVANLVSRFVLKKKDELISYGPGLVVFSMNISDFPDWMRPFMEFFLLEMTHTFKNRNILSFKKSDKIVKNWFLELQKTNTFKNKFTKDFFRNLKPPQNYNRNILKQWEFLFSIESTDFYSFMKEKGYSYDIKNLVQNSALANAKLELVNYISKHKDFDFFVKKTKIADFFYIMNSWLDAYAKKNKIVFHKYDKARIIQNFWNLLGDKYILPFKLKRFEVTKGNANSTLKIIHHFSTDYFSHNARYIGVTKKPILELFRDGQISTEILFVPIKDKKVMKGELHITKIGRISYQIKIENKTLASIEDVKQWGFSDISSDPDNPSLPDYVEFCNIISTYVAGQRNSVNDSLKISLEVDKTQNKIIVKKDDNHSRIMSMYLHHAFENAEFFNSNSNSETISSQAKQFILKIGEYESLSEKPDESLMKNFERKVTKFVEEANLYVIRNNQKIYYTPGALDIVLAWTWGRKNHYVPDSSVFIDRYIGDIIFLNYILKRFSLDPTKQHLKKLMSKQISVQGTLMGYSINAKLTVRSCLRIISNPDLIPKSRDFYLLLSLVFLFRHKFFSMKSKSSHIQKLEKMLENLNLKETYFKEKVPYTNINISLIK